MWFSNHFLIIIGCLIVAAYAMFIWTVWDLPWWRRIAVLALITIMMAIPLRVWWVVGTIPPVVHPPKPWPQVLICATVTQWNVPLMKDGTSRTSCMLLMNDPKGIEDQ
jgi:hypothetical protein